MEEAIDHELTSMVDAFSNMLKAARVPDDETEALALRERKDRAPGDLLEVWAEKLVFSGHTALGLISQLKRGALLSDFDSLITSIRAMRAAFSSEEEQVTSRLVHMRSDVQAWLAQLEASYYTSAHKPPPDPSAQAPEARVREELASLSQLAAEVASSTAAAQAAKTSRQQ